MRLKNLHSFKCKFLKPCKKIIQFFKFRHHKPVYIKALPFHHRKPKVKKTTHERKFPKILSVLNSLKRNTDMDRVTEMKSFSDVGHQRAPHPSPITPAYIRMRKEDRDEDDVEDACRSFENYLIEMIVEEGKMTDLVDVEELLYSWKNLKSPVFIDLVSRFYGELCKDLFSDSCGNDKRDNA